MQLDMFVVCTAFAQSGGTCLSINVAGLFSSKGLSTRSLSFALLLRASGVQAWQLQVQFLVLGPSHSHSNSGANFP